jgi:hypothetical protein
MLAFALLALVAYTATIGAVHTHGGNAAISLRFVGATNFIKANDDSSSLRKQFNGDDCLICQLQGHLSGGLFTDLPCFTLPQKQPAISLAIAFPALSQTRTSRRGRAPPANSLS